MLPSNTFIENTSFFLNCEGRMFVSNVAVHKKKKICNTESVLYNFFSYLFYKRCDCVNIKRIFMLFFYKNTLFFTKYKYIFKINISLLLSIHVISCFYKFIFFK